MLAAFGHVFGGPETLAIILPSPVVGVVLLIIGIVFWVKESNKLKSKHHSPSTKTINK
ncbi:MAG: hypothetical protein LBS76_01500 [Mycoplasmataceae bacterium]|nr:hypothetical protein [Mycoplasmataceae bacterium]